MMKTLSEADSSFLLKIAGTVKTLSLGQYGIGVATGLLTRGEILQDGSQTVFQYNVSQQA